MSLSAVDLVLLEHRRITDDATRRHLARGIEPTPARPTWRTLRRLLGAGGGRARRGVAAVPRFDRLGERGARP